MDIEFHYWITGIIAHRAGFDEKEAGIIAYSSQYVDDNDICLTVTDMSSGKKYYNFVSQTMNILKPKNQLMRIYPIFHFVPGDPLHKSAQRRDGKMHILNTTPDNGYANNLLQDALKSPTDIRLYRIGIATHAYADTWAHQNFVGWHDNFNALGINAFPNIGHADALHHPDWPGHRWTDNRLVDNDVKNNHRFLSAAERLFTHYCDFMVSKNTYTNQTRPSWNTLEKDLGEAFGSTYSGDETYDINERISRYKKLAPWLSDYDDEIWINNAVRTEVKGLKNSTGGILSHFTIFQDEYYWKEDRDRESTNWYKFQEAVKEHERFAIKILAPIFNQMDVNISKA